MGAYADAGGGGRDLVASVDADGAGWGVGGDGVDGDDAVVAGEVGREVEGGGAEVFEGDVWGERVISRWRTTAGPTPSSPMRMLPMP